MNENTVIIPEKGWQKPFFLVWTGQAFSLLGSQLVQFALIWYLTKKRDLQRFWPRPHWWVCCR